MSIDRGSGGRNCGQNGSSALEGEMYGQKDKRVLTASLEKPLTLWDIVRSSGILRHQFHMLNGCAPYAQRPSAASMGLDEGRFPCPYERRA
jgi:hypothetical protein